jgi:sigma-B regulation protein RsbU (phosphoserine phosphatase)
MPPATIFVVSHPSSTARHLCGVLAAEGITTRQLTPAEVLATPSVGEPETLLVNAGVPADLMRQITAWQAALPVDKRATVIAFLDEDLTSLEHEDLTSLEQHVLTGLDFLVPPFSPDLVLSRVRACRARQQRGDTSAPAAVAGQGQEYASELQVGRQVQQGFLPETLPERAGWQLTARFRPARHVSGDFYDAFPMFGGTRIGLVVADVCDKGVGAALFMALIRSLLRHTAVQLEACDLADVPPRGAGTGSVPEPVPEPPDTVDPDGVLLLRVIETINDYLTGNHLRQGYFATLFFAVLDPATGRLWYVNCGHNPPVLRGVGGGYRLLSPTGPALGLTPGPVFTLGHVRMEHDDLLFAYTDGVPDARDDAGRSFTEQQMLALVAQATCAEDLLCRIDRAIGAHVGTAGQFDDITMLALRRRQEST